MVPDCGQHHQHPNGDDGQQADKNGFASIPIGVLYYVALKFSIYSNTTIFQLFSWTWISILFYMQLDRMSISYNFIALWTYSTKLSLHSDELSLYSAP